jgi:hypothetical protein
MAKTSEYMADRIDYKTGDVLDLSIQALPNNLKLVGPGATLVTLTGIADSVDPTSVTTKQYVDDSIGLASSGAGAMITQLDDSVTDIYTKITNLETVAFTTTADVSTLNFKTTNVTRASGGGISVDGSSEFTASGDRDEAATFVGDVIVDGNVECVMVVTSSDARLKTNIKPLTNALSRIAQLDGYSFDWKATGDSSVGVIAQEVETVLPEAVINGSDGFLKVDYTRLIPLLIAAINELRIAT